MLRLFAVIGFLAMSLAIAYGLTIGDFASDGAALLANPWGVVSLIDLYVGFILFSLWIWYRETLLTKKIIWTTLMMVFGFWTASLYLLLVSYKSQTIEELLLSSKAK